MFEAMNLEVLMLHECLGTVLTLKLALLVGILGVLVEGILAGEQLATALLGALERLAGGFLGALVRLLEVPGEVKLPRVLLAAAGVGALERPISAVKPHVPFQLLPIRKTCGTTRKAAHKDSFVGHGPFHSQYADNPACPHAFTHVSDDDEQQNETRGADDRDDRWYGAALHPCTATCSYP